MVGKINRFLPILMLIATMTALVPAWAAGVNARVDRTQVVEGETLRFILRSEVDGEPDFAPLEQDFDVLSTAKSSQMSFVNGKMDSRTEWVVTLAPKRSGRLFIPSIKVGKARSKPLRVMVSPPDPNATGGAKGDLFIEAEAKPATAYVQSQLVYTVRLFQAVEIREAGLSEPKIEDAVVERLGDDATYTTTRNGRQYRVTERRYAVFPQTSGKLTIPPVVFGAQIVDDRGLRNGGPDPFNRFFQQPAFKPVRLRTQPITVKVRPKPDAVTTDWWLPAESVALSESWAPEPTVFRVGDSVTRVVTLEAVGLTGAQLPEILTAQSVDGIKTYPDQPAVETRSDGSSLQGVRQEKIALVPTRDGEVILPEIRIQWWDTRLDKARVAVLPERKINVLPAVNAATPSSPATATTEPAPDAPTQQPAPTGPFIFEGKWSAYMPWAVATFFGVAWLATVLGWWYKSRRRRNVDVDRETRPPKPTAQLKLARDKLKRATLERSPAMAKDALLEWAAVQWPEHSPASIGAVAQWLGSAELKQETDKINQVMYGTGSRDWDGDAFWKAFERARRAVDDGRSVPASALPDLYPR